MTHRVLVALLVLASAASAEERFGAKGQVVPLGTISFSHISDGADVNVLNLAPGLLWFAAKSVALGGQVTVTHIGIQGGSQTTLGFAPTVGYALPLGDRAALFPRAGIQFNFTWPVIGSMDTSVALSTFAPLLFFPVPHFYIGVGPQFAVEFTSPNTLDIGFASEIGGYF